MKYLNFFKKGLLFIFRYIVKDPVYVFLYLSSYPKSRYKTEAVFFDENEFIKKINEGKSIIRIGDGEIGIIHGADIHYQNFNRELRNDLISIIKNYDDNSKYILALPKFVSMDNNELKKTNGKLECWLPLKVEFNRIANKKAKYFDAHYFYYGDKMRFFFKDFLDNKRVIFVTNKSDIEKIKEVSQGKKYLFVETPDSDSYNQKNLIKSNINEIIKDDLDYVMVFSCGPLSKSLAYYYSDLGYRSYDVGFGLRYIWDDGDYSNVI